MGGSPQLFESKSMMVATTTTPTTTSTTMDTVLTKDRLSKPMVTTIPSPLPPRRASSFPDCLEMDKEDVEEFTMSTFSSAMTTCQTPPPLEPLVMSKTQSNNHHHHGGPGHRRSKSVGFGNIEVREYNLQLGDHPCCSMGCPIELGWEYMEENVQPLETYEASRCPRRSRDQLKTTYAERREMLCNVVSDTEMKRAERKQYRERNCQRKIRNKTCAAFFQGPPPTAPAPTESS